MSREDEVRALLLVFVTQLRLQTGLFNYTQMCLMMPALPASWRKTLSRFCNEEQRQLIYSLQEVVAALRKEQ